MKPDESLLLLLLLDTLHLNLPDESGWKWQTNIPKALLVGSD